MLCVLLLPNATNKLERFNLVPRDFPFKKMGGAGKANHLVCHGIHKHQVCSIVLEVASKWALKFIRMNKDLNVTNKVIPHRDKTILTYTCNIFKALHWHMKSNQVQRNKLPLNFMQHITKCTGLTYWFEVLWSCQNSIHRVLIFLSFNIQGCVDLNKIKYRFSHS